MKHHLEKLNENLRILNFQLTALGQLARVLNENGLPEKLAEHLPEVVAFIRRTFPREEAKMFMADVIGYLGISERTYYRKIAEGKLVPRKWEGPDFFYRSDLAEEHKESKRRGRI